MAKQRIANTEITVGPDECRVAREGERLVARHILSDVVVAIHVPAAGFAAMLRLTAPDSSADPDRALQSPWSFADTGLPLFLATVGSLACRYSTVYTVGAATLYNGDRALPLGAQNRLAVQRILWREGVLARGEDLGGHRSRSLWLDAASGRLIVRTAAQPVHAFEVEVEADREEAQCHRAS
jgi:chemotaxis protein CheD